MIQKAFQTLWECSASLRFNTFNLKRIFTTESTEPTEGFSVISVISVVKYFFKLTALRRGDTEYSQIV
jgi:hypothetical protein